MKTCSVGTKLFCDYHFGGKPKAICLEVIKPGNGKDNNGRILAKLTETVGAYRKGETVELTTFQAVPCSMILPLESGQYYTRVSTQYQWAIAPA